jgi:hypothetical protein
VRRQKSLKSSIGAHPARREEDFARFARHRWGNLENLSTKSDCLSPPFGFGF